MVNGPGPAAAPATAEAAASVRGVTMRFGSNVVFRDVSFDVRRGEVFVILGGHGTGIGLVLSREIVENHGGSIALQNRVGAKGCVATVRLPLG